MISAFAVLFASLLSIGHASNCSLSCAVGATCYAYAGDAMECLNSVPFNKDWASATVDVISQSLMNYGFLQLYHNTGPPYVTQLDIQEELMKTQSMIDSGAFATDHDFQDHITDLITATQDAHTRYSKPVCYNALFLQPFALDLRVETADGVVEEPKAFLMRNLYTDQYIEMFPDSKIESLFGQEVVLLNGVELITELTSWADAHETRSNNRGVRFNSAVRNYLYRSAIQYNVRPLDDLKITLSDGSSFSFPWLAVYSSGLGDVDVCAAAPAKLSEEEKVSRKRIFPGVNRTHHPHLFDPPAPLSHSVLRSAGAERVVIIPADSDTQVSCFTQKVDNADAGVSNALVMKVASFAPESVTGFLQSVETCLSTEFDLLVVDVMQNGGGIVCLGVRLLELLVEEFNLDHTKVEMNYDLPHSPLMDAYIKEVNSNEGYMNPATREVYEDGEAYYYGRNVTMGGVEHQRSNYFYLDCSAFESLPLHFTPKKFMSPERLVMLTDGTCGSTTALFTKVASESGKATLVGAGGLWEESMDVASFAGGFVSNPDTMASIAKETGLSFPEFQTDQHWQFDWAIWYSQKFPTRPAQFVVTEPTYRESFWGFPHASIDSAVTTAMVSSLYDRVIDSAVARLAEDA